MPSTDAESMWKHPPSLHLVNVYTSYFHTCSPVSMNDVSLGRVLFSGMTHVNVFNYCRLW